MWMPPIIERELRVALRKHNPVKSRLHMALAGGGVSAFFLLVGMLGDGRWWTRMLHGILFLLGIYGAAIRPAQLGAGLFSEDRRTNTLELLYLTGMDWKELFLSKVIGATLVAASDLLAACELGFGPSASRG